MGIRVQFYEGAVDGLESVFLAALPDFRKWYTELAADYPADCGPGPLEIIDQLIEVGRTALLPATIAECRRIDEVVDIFLGDYMDWGGVSSRWLPDLHDSMLSLRWFEELEPTVNKSTPALIQFWKFLLVGRPLARDASQQPYRSSDGVFRWCYLSAVEAEAVCDSLNSLRADKAHRLSKTSRDVLAVTEEAISEAVHRKIGLVITVA